MRCRLVHAFALLSLLLLSASASNVPSDVIELNDKFIDVKDDGYWFVKLYAPWCAHCKRLNPVWEHVGHSVKDQAPSVRVGSLDCTRFASACNSLKITGYPTLLFFRNGESINYEGEREKEALVDFALKCSAPSVSPIPDLVRLNEIRERSQNEPAFIVVEDGPAAQKQEDAPADEIVSEFKATASRHFYRTRFYSISRSLASSALKSEGVVFVIREKQVVPFTGKAVELGKFVLGERWPLIAKGTPSSLGILGASERLLVLILVNQVERYNKSTATGVFYAEVAEAAREARKDPVLAHSFQFAWLDGNSLANSIVSGYVDVPGYLVLNHSSYEHYLPLDSAEKTTRQSLLLWLHSVVKGEQQPLGGRHLSTRIYRIFYELVTNVKQMFATQPLLSCCIFGVPLAFFSIILYTLCSSDFSVDRDEIYPDDEEEVEDEATEDEPDHNSPIDENHEKAE